MTSYRMNMVTYKFLRRCQKYGIKRVSISVRHKSIPASLNLSWPSDPWGFVFSAGDYRYDGWPALWRVCEELKVAGRSGGNNWHTVHMTSGLRPGVYHLRNKKWYVIGKDSK